MARTVACVTALEGSCQLLRASAVVPHLGFPGRTGTLLLVLSGQQQCAQQQLQAISSSSRTVAEGRGRQARAEKPGQEGMPARPPSEEPPQSG